MVTFLAFVCGILLGGIASLLFTQNRLSQTYKQKIKELRLRFENEQRIRIGLQAKLEAADTIKKENADDLKKNLDALISKAILQNNNDFINLAEQSIEKLINKSEGELNKKTDEMKRLLAPLKENFTKQEELLKDFQLNNSKTYGSLKHHLDELVKNQKSLERETGALVTALKAPKVRGRWGEIGLKRIVEFSGMSSFCDFHEQVYNQEAGVKPDMIVNLPDKKQIIIDSKVPLNAYLDAMEAENEEDKKNFLIKHSRALAGHVKNLSSKAYWSEFEGAVDFVVLYIEIEPAFGAALSENKNLIEEALKNRIILATPTTLITMLQTIAFSWRQHKATENAMKIWGLSSELYQRLAKFSEYFQKTGQLIDSLAKSYNAAVGSWESRIIPGIKKIEEQGINSQKKNIEEPSRIETSIREMKK